MRVIVSRSQVIAVAAMLVAGCGTRVSPVQQAALLSEKGHDPEAIAVLRADLAKHPAAIGDRRLLVRLEAVTGNLDAAEREAGELAAHLPADSPIPWIELGHALEIVHRFNEALSLYDRAASVAPRDPAGPRTGGLRAAHWGELELAAPRLEEALRRNPADAVVWHALGLVRVHSGDLDGARTAYESGLRADPHALENRVGLATVALKQKNAAEALDQYDRVLGERPAFAEGYLGRAWALIALGRFDEATTSLVEARRRGADARAIALQESLVAALRTKEGAQRMPRNEHGDPLIP